jgi:hypothetical protein
MSRISRYQESIEKFIKNKNIINKFKTETVEIIKPLFEKSDHLCGIILSTILNHNSRKTNFKSHGYYLAAGINLLLILLHIKERRESYDQLHGKNKIDNCLNELLIKVYDLLNESCETVKHVTRVDEVNKIIIFCNTYFNSKILDIININKDVELTKMVKSDLLNIKNISINTELKTSLSKMQKIEEKYINNYIKLKYGNIGKIVMVVGWALGGGIIDNTKLELLEGIGSKLGIIYKICKDFEQLIPNIKEQNKFTFNTVINLGIHETFTLFMENKTQFIEESLELDIYTHTTKEVIDILEKNIDKCLEEANIDMKSSYSSFSNV